MFKYLLFSTLFLLPALAAQAQFTETIAYQGYLTDVDGNPIDNPDLPIRFSFFDQGTGGTRLWNEAHGSVAVTEGVFSVQLGQFEPFDGVPFDGPLFLEVALGDIPNVDVLTPRIPLTAVPYSLRAKSLDDGALVAGQNVTIQRNGDAFEISATGGGNGGVPSRLAAPDGSPGDAVVVNEDGRVGVGGIATNAIVAPLHVRRDDLSLPESAVVNPGLAVEASDANLGIYSSNTGTFGSALSLGEVVSGTLVDQWSLVRETSTGSGVSRLRFTYGANPNYSVNETKLALYPNGLVGIGTDDPQSLLHVSTLGDAEFILEADTDNTGEDHNPAILLRQDGNAANAFIAMEGNAGTRSSGTLANALVIGSEDDNPALQFVTNDEVRMTIGLDGAITAPPRTSILTISPMMFTPAENGYSFASTPGFLGAIGGREQRWFAPVQLPHGAVVTRVTSHWVDNTQDILILRLERNDDGDVTGELMATLNSIGSGGNGTRTDDIISNATIDNSRFIYYVRMEFPAGSSFGALLLQKVVIEYTTTRIH